MKWVIDLDGVISANPDFFKWWTYHLKKKMNNHEISILTSRNPSRRQETIDELKFWGISYDRLYTMPENLLRDYKTQGEWKLKWANFLEADVWLDNDFKVYEKVCGVDLKTNAEKILI